jgi:hypothetical protein
MPEPLGAETKTSPQSQPHAPPIGDRDKGARFFLIHTVSAIPGQLLDGIVECVDIAANTAQQGDGNFKDRYETMIVRIADGAAH